MIKVKKKVKKRVDTFVKCDKEYLRPLEFVSRDNVEFSIHRSGERQLSSYRQMMEDMRQLFLVSHPCVVDTCGMHIHISLFLQPNRVGAHIRGAWCAPHREGGRASARGARGDPPRRALHMLEAGREGVERRVGAEADCPHPSVHRSRRAL